MLPQRGKTPHTELKVHPLKQDTPPIPRPAQWETQGSEWALTLMFVSWEPEATNSPYGWKSRLQMLALCPMSVRRTERKKAEMLA